MSNIKKININFEPEKDKEKLPKKREITNTIEWIETENKYTHQEQINILNDFFNSSLQDKNLKNIIQKEINKKISGYKSQDKLKNLYDENKFIKKKDALQLLYDSKLICYYCKEDMRLFYDTVRDNKQWSFDRLENEEGHNVNNLVVSCLSCNLSRKTLYHERFLFTKQLGTIKKI
jgi:hypothetical protein